ncbi:uncharacterized protein LOC121829580 [Peromyscus maniculatus bairdii]|uniref:uncharacterized protein LOC121829580 n=1 Tax=Peromyscus maniculatus bairdii TaxID=230844 RepID=UPI003FD67F55
MFPRRITADFCVDSWRSDLMGRFPAGNRLARPGVWAQDPYHKQDLGLDFDFSLHSLQNGLKTPRRLAGSQLPTFQNQVLPHPTFNDSVPALTPMQHAWFLRIPPHCSIPPIQPAITSCSACCLHHLSVAAIVFSPAANKSLA